MIRRSRLFAILLSLLVAAALISPASAEATTTWHCSPFGTVYQYVCTTIRGATNGVHVLDRSTGNVVTWQNGTSVALLQWAVDPGGSCGVNGDVYVWKVGWFSGGTTHWGVLGDWYLDTGAWSDWRFEYDSWGYLETSPHYAGSGSGTCNVFNPSNW
jgi:hypothetical protein